MSDCLPSLNALRAFETVSRHLNYRKAAEELHVSPGAVKQLVYKLEAALGKSLLEKRGQGLVLTAAGEAASRDLIRAFGQIADTVEKIRMMDQGSRLVISVAPSFAAAWLIPRLQDFRTKNPAIDVLIDSSMRVVDLRRGVADIAIRFGVPVDEGLVSHRLFDEEICAFCSPHVAEAHPGVHRLQDLDKATLLRWDLSSFERSSATRRWYDWDHWLAAVGASGIHVGEGLQFDDYNLMVQAAISGQGVFLGSRPILQGLVEKNLLVNPLSERAITGIGHDLVMIAKARDKPEVARFFDWIVEAAKRSI